MKKSWEGFVSSRVTNEQLMHWSGNGELLKCGLIYDIKVGDMRKIRVTIESIGKEKEPPEGMQKILDEVEGKVKSFMLRVDEGEQKVGYRFTKWELPEL